jgi:hypothetical protein
MSSLTRLGLMVTAEVVLSAAAGCSRQPVEETHTVSWYLQHKEERTAKVKWCEDSADRATISPTCLNAAEAAQKAMLQPNAPSIADGIKLP